MIRVVVPISGGKDSQACLKLALKNFPSVEVLGLFCDTRFEHPLTYEHVQFMRDVYGVRIDTVSAGSVPGMILKYNRFPNGAQRFCTDELKIRPSKKYYAELALRQGNGFEVWYGMRLAESAQRKKRYAGKVCDEVYAPHEFMPSKYPKYLAKRGVVFRLPILDWCKEDVLGYLDWEANPLYRVFDRVGCFPCQAAGVKHKQKAYSFDAFGQSQNSIIRILEDITQKKSGGTDCDFQGCGICAT